MEFPLHLMFYTEVWAVTRTLAACGGNALRRSVDIGHIDGARWPNSGGFTACCAASGLARGPDELFCLLLLPRPAARLNHCYLCCSHQQCAAISTCSIEAHSKLLLHHGRQGRVCIGRERQRTSAACDGAETSESIPAARVGAESRFPVALLQHKSKVQPPALEQHSRWTESWGKGGVRRSAAQHDAGAAANATRRYGGPCSRPIGNGKSG